MIEHILNGMLILRMYTNSNYPISAEHDVIYFHTNECVPFGEALRLYRLGWHVDKETYEENRSWYHYV